MLRTTTFHFFVELGWFSGVTQTNLWDFWRGSNTPVALWVIQYDMLYLHALESWCRLKPALSTAQRIASKNRTALTPCISQIKQRRKLWHI